MGKATGFMEYGRKEMKEMPVRERVKSFAEFRLPLKEEARREQAARCMDCGVPFCQSAMKLSGMVTGCPLHNLIPEWNDALYAGQYAHALTRLLKTSSFPEFTGRVCPALCEKACMCGQYGDPVSVHDNELFLIEYGFAHGLMKPRIPKIRSGKTVAVVGSGPAGLAAADALNRRGHRVTVYEREDRIGGLLMYGIPNMKLDKAVILRRQRLMEEEGVIFRTGVDIGRDLSAEELLASCDAVILACGAKKARGLKGAVKTLKGAETELHPDAVKGIYYAVDFLKSTTKDLLKGAERSADALHEAGITKSAKGKHVIVVGGGDTGNDCIGTVIREGCASVTALEMMPEPPAERLPSNPWPEWPKVKKTDYAHVEAIELFGKDVRIYETTVKEFYVDRKNELKKVKTVKVAFKDGSLSEVPGTEQVLPCDLLLIAAGFVGCEDYTADAFGLKKTARGAVEAHKLVRPSGDFEAFGHKDHADFGCQTDIDKVFAAGDMRRGQSLVVWAITEGRECAREVDEYLMGYTI